MFSSLETWAGHGRQEGGKVAPGQEGVRCGKAGVCVVGGGVCAQCVQCVWEEGAAQWCCSVAGVCCAIVVCGKEHRCDV